MNQQLGHLSEQQIRECAGTAPGSGLEDVEAHLSQCESCLGRLLEWQRTQFRFGEAGAMRSKPNTDCEKERDLQEVAAQMASPETSTRVLQHASQCERCGRLLSQYLEDFSAELSPEIEALIARLPFSQPQAQREKAREIVRKLRPEPVSWWKSLIGLWSRKWIPVTVGATAVLAVFSLVGVPMIWNAWNETPARQFVRASKERRTVEPRFSGEPYSKYDPTVSTLGPEDQDLQGRPALSNALNNIIKKKNSGKAGPGDFQLYGRLILLQNPSNWKKARDAFETAKARGLHSASLKIDLGIAYLQQANNSDKHDFSDAIKEFNNVLQDNTATREEKNIAQFNLALAYQQSASNAPGATENATWGLAISAWKEYLNMDRSSEWAGEAGVYLECAQVHKSVCVK